jgi:predicted nuclease of predicted toxin-antitoxin system
VSTPRTFWVDENLPPQLAKALAARGGIAAVHFRDLPLLEAADRDIFFRARTAGATIVTKDEDFPLLVGQLGTPPQIVWVRLGNSSTRLLLRAFDMHHDSLIELLDSGVPLVSVQA